MTAKRHNDDPAEFYLDAAKECVLAVGVKRTSLTDVARRAGVSRMTLYRRWPDMDSLFADLMTREWLAMADEAFRTASKADEVATPSRIARAVVDTVVAFRANPLFAKIVEVDADLLLPYLLQRRGRSQDAVLSLLSPVLAQGRRTGAIRDVDAGVLSRMLLLAAQGFALSAPTMADGTSMKRLREELACMLERYLTP